MQQISNISLQMVSCWLILLMLYLPILDICGFNWKCYPIQNHTQRLQRRRMQWGTSERWTWCSWLRKRQQYLHKSEINKQWKPMQRNVNLKQKIKILKLVVSDFSFKNNGMVQMNWYCGTSAICGGSSIFIWRNPTPIAAV